MEIAAGEHNVVNESTSREGDAHVRGETGSRRTLALALAVACMAACGGSAVGAVDGPVLTSPPASGDSGFDAIVGGTVEMRGDCLVLADPGDLPGPAHPVIWPAGTTWQADPAAVVLAHGQVVELGTEVRGGGGYFPRDGVTESVAPAVADALDSCRGESSEIVVFNAGSDVEVP